MSTGRYNPKVPDLLKMVRDRLQDPEISPRLLSAETGVGYDVIIRIRRAAEHDPSWSAVYRLAKHLFRPSRGR